MASLNSVVIARLASAVYGLQLGSATMNEAIEAANVLGGGDAGVAALMQMLYGRDFAGVSNSQLAAKIVSNVGITDPALVTEATTVVTNLLDASAPGAIGQTLVNIVNSFSLLTADPAYGVYARAFNQQIGRAIDYANTFGTPDVMVSAVTPVFNLAPGSAAGIPVMQLTGNMDVRIDFTNPNNQVTGLDLNGNGVIEPDGVENAQKGIAANFQGVDAYARNPLNERDSANNFLGDIYFDGTGFGGDGKSTNGNIFLGGLGADVALGGIGNDFLVGGGVGEKAGGFRDELRGGRNADVFFVELSRLSNTDGNNILIDGGTTADDIIPGDPAAVRGLGTQDNDWVLLEVSDDDEPVTASLAGSFINTAAGAGTDALLNVESVNASGNLYGFLDNVDVVIGSRAYDGYGDSHSVGSPNYGRGSTAQLILLGNANNNALIGGYDNDKINGDAGDDLLMGGDLRFLITHKNNPNLLDSNGGLALNKTAQGLVNDGKDSIAGGAGNDNIVFESDNGSIDGGADTATTSGTKVDGTITRDYLGPRMSSSGDSLWITDFSMGRLYGATLADEATAQQTAMAKLTTDSTYRIDLGGGNNFRNYGGAVTSSQDTTNYVGTASRVAVSAIESVNATGLGAIDYKLAGSNAPETAFNNQQNYSGFTGGNLDLRGNGVDNVLLASTGNDVLEGRGGDDVLSGGGGNDRFIVQFGDGVDWVARPVDANGDNIWDTSGGLKVIGGLAWGQDFRAPAAPTAGRTTLVVDFGTTVLNGVDTGVVTFQVRIDGVDFGTTLSSAALFVAKSTADLAAIVNANYSAQDPNVSVVAVSPSKIEVRAIDPTPGDGKLPEISTLPADGFFVSGTAAGVGTFQAKGSILGLSGTDLEDDILVIKTYEDRSINLGVNQAKVEISQAAQMAVSFGADGSRLTQGQEWQLFLENVREGDTVRVTVNGQKYDYTLAAGENADVAAVKLATVIANALDPHSASGTLGAKADLATFGDPIEGKLGANSAGVSITQSVVSGASQAFMDISSTVVRADGKAPFGSTSLHNQSATAIQMLGFDGRNGALNRQDEAASPVVLFQGRNDGDSTMSLLLTAKDAGGKLSGMDANFNAAGNGNWINGDDHLIGGLGNDQIFGGTGDDLIEMSKGVDSVDGGGNAKLNDGTMQKFTDILQAQERTFGEGSYFKVTLDPTLYANGKGSVAAIGADGKPTGDVTSFVDIELVRVLENNRNSELDVEALSDAVAAAAASGPAGGILPAEGLVVNVTNTPSTKYTIDKNNNGVIDPNETFTATAVLGTESVTTGKANDTIIVDHTHANANNRFSMGDQQDNPVTLAEGADTVIYQHGALAAADQPIVTIGVAGMSAGTVMLTGGALGSAKFTDTLTGVEVVNVAAAATSSKFADVLDLSALKAAVVNYGAPEAVGATKGGSVTPPSTPAEAEADTLENGGIATPDALGKELMEVVGITLVERVVGSPGDDRVILADGMQPSVLPVTTTPVDTTWFTSKAAAAVGYGFGTAQPATNDGLYRFDLGDGDDALDYKQELAGISVQVDTSGTTSIDRVFVSAGFERVDVATNVERYFGSPFYSLIDLVSSTVDTTIEFSKEAGSNVPANDKPEPQGNDGTVTTDETRAAEVRETGSSTALALFMDRTGANDIGVPAVRWQYVVGSNSKAETVLLTDNEADVFHELVLLGGKNVVNYSAMSSTVGASIGGVTRSADQFQAQVVSIGGTGGDVVRQTINLDNANNYLTLVGSGASGDTVGVSGLFFQIVTPGTFGTPANRATLSSANAGSPTQRHVVDLSSGQVREDTQGQYGDFAGVVRPANFLTMVSGFENATNAGGADRVTLVGNNGINGLTGGTGDDVILGGRGIAPIGSATTGDVLSGGGGQNWFVYSDESESPDGSVTGGNQSSAIFGTGAAGDAAVIRARDTIQGFVSGTDSLVFVVSNDGWDVVKAAGGVPGNLAAPLGSVTPATITPAANQVQVVLPVTSSGPLVAQDQEYFINTPAATATLSDFIFRVQMTSGGDTVDAGLGLATTNLDKATIADDGVAVHFVYTDAGQSQAGGFDEILNFNSAAGDRIDLSFLRAPEWEARFGTKFDADGDNIADAIQNIRVLAAPVSINANLPNMFVEPGDFYRAVTVQTVLNGFSQPTTYVFVDVNADGDYVVGQDMVISVVGVGSLAVGDFIFDRYDIFGAGNEIPGFAGNLVPGT